MVEACQLVKRLIRVGNYPSPIFLLESMVLTPMAQAMALAKPSPYVT